MSKSNIYLITYVENPHSCLIYIMILSHLYTLKQPSPSSRPFLHNIRADPTRTFISITCVMLCCPDKLAHKVRRKENKLGVKQATIDGMEVIDCNKFAAWKELLLAEKCKVRDHPRPWHFWMVMLKSGNMDTEAAICPKDGTKSSPFAPEPRFPCFGEGCMNMPSIHHRYTRLVGKRNRTMHMRGGFFGTWDLDADMATAGVKENVSYYSITWEKSVGKGGWVFKHVLKTSPKYPWLMLYLRSDATRGFSGGYHYQTRGMTKIVSFLVFFSLVVLC